MYYPTNWQFDVSTEPPKFHPEEGPDFEISSENSFGRAFKGWPEGAAIQLCDWGWGQDWYPTNIRHGKWRGYVYRIRTGACEAGPHKVWFGGYTSVTNLAWVDEELCFKKLAIFKQGTKEALMCSPIHEHRANVLRDIMCDPVLEDIRVEVWRDSLHGPFMRPMRVDVSAKTPPGFSDVRATVVLWSNSEIEQFPFLVKQEREAAEKLLDKTECALDAPEGLLWRRLRAAVPKVKDLPLGIRVVREGKDFRIYSTELQDPTASWFHGSCIPIEVWEVVADAAEGKQTDVSIVYKAMLSAFNLRWEIDWRSKVRPWHTWEEGNR